MPTRVCGSVHVLLGLRWVEQQVVIFDGAPDEGRKIWVLVLDERGGERPARGVLQRAPKQGHQRSIAVGQPSGLYFTSDRFSYRESFERTARALSALVQQRIE